MAVVVIDERLFGDWTTPATKVRWRLVMTPRAVTLVNLDGTFNTATNVCGTADPAVTLSPWDDQPAFGAASAAGWRKLPDGTFYNLQIPDHGYDALPVGWPDPPSLSFDVKTGALEAEGHTDMVEALTDPGFEFLGQHFMASAAVAASACVPAYQVSVVSNSWRAVNTTHVWHLLTDDGDASLTIDQFRIAGIFGHERSESQKHSQDPRTGESVISLKLVHIAWLVLAAILPSDLAHAVANNVAAEREDLRIWDVAWRSATAGLGYGRAFGSRAGDSDPDKHYLYNLSDVTGQILDLSQRVLKCFLRCDATFGTAAMPAGLTRTVLYKQSQTVANVRTTIVTAPMVCCFRKGNVSGNDRGGWLSPLGGKESTAFEFASLDALLIAGTEGVVQKLDLQTPTPNSITMSERGVTESVAALLVAPDERWFGQEIDIGAAALSGADVDIPGTQEADQQSIELRLENIRDHNNRTVPVVWQNQPQVGPVANMAYESDIIGGDTYQIAVSAMVTMNVLFYEAELGDTGTTAAIRCHHAVGITDGATEYDECADGIALPDPGLLVGVAQIDAFIGALRLAMIQMQAEGCIPFAAATRMANRFSSRMQAGYPGRVDATLAGTNQLGRRASLADWPDGEALTGKSWHASVPGEPILLRTSLVEATGKADVILIGLGGS